MLSLVEACYAFSRRQCGRIHGLVTPIVVRLPERVSHGLAPDRGRQQLVGSVKETWLAGQNHRKSPLVPPGRGEGARGKHGLRSKYQPAVLMSRIEEMRNSEKLVDLKNMLAVQHILLAIALEKLQEAESNPQAISALLSNVQSITETISKNIERHHKMTDSDGNTPEDSFRASFEAWQSLQENRSRMPRPEKT